MKLTIIIKILSNLLLSVVCGTLIWWLAQALLLPVTDADDGAGHGPDAGTVEWHGVIQRRTERYQRDAIDYGVMGGVVAFTALTLVWRLRHRRAPQR